MATYTTSTVIPAVGTTANLVAWVAAWDSILTSAGWIQTADTGQTASGSFVGTASLNTAQGYQIWGMADALQSTYPVFMKLEWGTGGTANFPSVWITMGTASNGSGTITGTNIPRTQFQSAATNATALPIYASGTTSRLTIYSFYSVTLNTFVYLNIERAKDAAQADTGQGILFHGFNGAGAGAHGYFPFSAPWSRYGWVGAMPLVPTYAAMGSGSDGASTIMVLPVIEFNVYGTVNYGIGTLAYYNSDMTTANQYTIAVNGVNHNYYALRGFNFPAFVNWTGSALLMLYE